MVKGIHYNYLISGKNDNQFTLLNEDNIKKIYEAFEPLSRHVEVRKAKISAIQIAREPGKYVKVGRPKWNLTDLETLCTNYKAYTPHQFSFTVLGVEFPSVESSYKKGETTQLKMSIENDGIYGMDQGSKNCGMVLSVRSDIYEQAGETMVHAFLKQVCGMMYNTVVLFKKRDFFDGGVSMMDASVWRYNDKLYKKEYAAWNTLEL